MSDAQIHVRRLETLAEFHRAEETQREIWSMPGELDVVPLHLLVTAQKNGGLVLGAFHGEQMIGFLFGFLGRAGDGSAKHCSHMMGVLPAYRGQGIGELLKRHQRELVTAQGIDLITWTYDPLERANATLNLHKLGATCRTYLRNIYGGLRDGLNRGLPTDRFEVEWRTNSPRSVPAGDTGRPDARSLLGGDLPLATQVSLNRGGFAEPEAWKQIDAAVVLAEVPARFQQLKAYDAALALRWRLMTRELFEAYFAAGYAAVDFLTVAESAGERSFYILEREGKNHAT